MKFSARLIHCVVALVLGMGASVIGCSPPEPYQCPSQSGLERTASQPPYCPSDEPVQQCYGQDLDDGNPCTRDICKDDIPTHELLPSGTQCDDGDACTMGDSCQLGSCISGPSMTCNDGRVCRAAQCVALCAEPFGHTLSTGALTGGLGAAGALEVADFNGDGALDLVVAEAQAIAFFFNAGDGTFTAAAPHPVSSQPGAIVAADLNNDAMPDLAFTSYTGAMIGGASLEILFNQGDGTFAGQIELALGSSSGNVLAKDLNGDGTLDIVVPVDGKTSVFFNQGGGIFGPPIQYPISEEARFVAAGDFDGDGALDLALTAFTNGLRILFNDGSGGFGSPVSYGGFDGATSSLSVADFNGDGSTDLVVGVYTSVATTLLNNGDGKFTNVAKAELASSGPMIAVDIDVDGWPDLATANYLAESVSLLLNKGDGTFAPRADYLAGKGSGAIVTADFDADGKPDLAFTNIIDSSVSIYLNGCFQGSP